MLHIIIIGAGASGLGAASRLCEKGFNPTQITILEAEDRIGGRVHTIQHGSNVIELGAQWVHGEVGNPVYELARTTGEILLDLKTLESTGDADNVVTAYPETGKKISPQQLSEFKKVVEDIYLSAEKELAQWDKSFGEFFIKKFEGHINQGSLKTLDHETALDLLDWAHRSENIEDGSDNWLTTCGSGWLEYEECDGNYTHVWKRGYSVLFDILMRNIPKANNGQQLPLSDRIHLNSPVQSIHWDSPDGKVKVHCKDKTFEADIVLVTCSLGVLKERADQLFSPLLPEKKREAITGIGFGTVDKIYLEFSKPFWSADWGGVNFLTKSAKRSSDWSETILGFFTVRNQPNLLEGWITGPAARQAETIPEAEVRKKCSDLLRGAVSADFDYSEPIGMIITNWHSNPNFRGSYSFRSIKSKERNVWASDLAEPVKDSKGVVKLLFAGEATNTHHYSNVHGALETGWREADRIIEMTSSNNIPSKL